MRGTRCGRGDEASREGVDEVGGRAGTGVRVEHEVAEAKRRQPSDDGVDRGALLRDEQRALAVRGQGGDEICDRLALAGAGWAHEDEVLSTHDGVDRRLLRRVGVEDEKLLARVGVEPSGGRLGADVEDRRLVTGHRGDDGVRVQARRLLCDVAHHRKLRVAERRDDEALVDAEPRDRRARAAHHRVRRGRVEPVRAGRRRRHVLVIDVDAA